MTTIILTLFGLVAVAIAASALIVNAHRNPARHKHGDKIKIRYYNMTRDAEYLYQIDEENYLVRLPHENRRLVINGEDIL